MTMRIEFMALSRYRKIQRIKRMSPYVLDRLIDSLTDDDVEALLRLRLWAGRASPINEETPVQHIGHAARRALGL